MLSKHKLLSLVILPTIKCTMYIYHRPGNFNIYVDVRSNVYDECKIKLNFCDEFMGSHAWVQRSMQSSSNSLACK